MRAIDAEKPASDALAPHGKVPASHGTDHRPVLVADGSDTSVRQWAMLFQPKPSEVKLRTVPRHGRARRR